MLKTKKGIKVMLTAFRDGFQSVYGGRILLPDFIDILPLFIEAGIRRFEVWGGARFQTLPFYCNENPWDSMDALRRKVDEIDAGVQFQSLARGNNVVGLESQSADIVKLHADLFAKHGVNIIRNFDALNDIQNLEYSGRCIVKAGLHHEITITMMQLPPECQNDYFHTANYYLDLLKEIIKREIPFHSLCFKDASGTSNPMTVFKTIQGAREILDNNSTSQKDIVFHTHDTGGIATIQYLRAIEAGVDQIDLSVEPVSHGTAQPNIMAIHEILKGTDYYLEGIDIPKLIEAEEALKKSLAKYMMPLEAKRINPMILRAPMPGGALTANTNMMRKYDILHLLDQTIAAMPEVISKGGFATSVTPASQFYFQQALSNVRQGPWKKIVEGYGLMILGYFGRTPAEPDPEIVALASKQLNLPVNSKPVLKINNKNPKKGIKVAKNLLKQNNLDIHDENIFIVATCGQKGVSFLLGKAEVEVFYADNVQGLKAQKENLSKALSEVSDEIAEIKRRKEETDKDFQKVLAELYLSEDKLFVLNHPGVLQEAVNSFQERASQGTQGG